MLCVRPAPCSRRGGGAWLAGWVRLKRHDAWIWTSCRWSCAGFRIRRTWPAMRHSALAPTCLMHAWRTSRRPASCCLRSGRGAPRPASQHPRGPHPSTHVHSGEHARLEHRIQLLRVGHVRKVAVHKAKQHHALPAADVVPPQLVQADARCAPLRQAVRGGRAEARRWRRRRLGRGRCVVGGCGGGAVFVAVVAVAEALVEPIQPPQVLLRQRCRGCQPGAALRVIWREWHCPLHVDSCNTKASWCSCGSGMREAFAGYA